LRLETTVTDDATGAIWVSNDTAIPIDGNTSFYAYLPYIAFAAGIGVLVVVILWIYFSKIKGLQANQNAKRRAEEDKAGGV